MGQIQIRDVIETDLEIFYEHQNDSVANELAAFPHRDKSAFLKHWKTKTLKNPKTFKRTILQNNNIVGNVVCWEQDGHRVVGYWIGRSYWGQGIATEALSEFLKEMKIRPLTAFVVKHNRASIRVLEKCNFKIIGEGTFFSVVHRSTVEEYHLRLD